MTVSQQTPITPYVCPRGHHAIQWSREGIRCETCRNQGFATASWGRDAVVDLRGGEPPLADETPPDNPDAGAEGPPPATEIDRLVFSSRQCGTDRRLHVSANCAHARRISDEHQSECSVQNMPGRGQLCDSCAGGLSVGELRRAHGLVATDGGQRGDGVVQYDSINEFVVVGDFGFNRVQGPWRVEKAGTKWTIILPYEELDRELSDTDEGRGAVLIADGKAVGGGLVDLVYDPEGEGEQHVVIDQYARGDI